MDGGAYVSEAMPHVFGRVGSRQASLQGEGEIAICRKNLTSGWLISSQGNQQGGRPLTAPLVRTLTSWDLGRTAGRQSCEQTVGKAGTGGTGDVERARDQSPWVA